MHAGGRIPAAPGPRARARSVPCGEPVEHPLFVGFPGFTSKLWLAHDECDRYRGVYEWDGQARAEHYARSLWRVLALVSVPGSIRYAILPGLRRDQVIADPGLVQDGADGAAAWWRIKSTA